MSVPSVGLAPAVVAAGSCEGSTTTVVCVSSKNYVLQHSLVQHSRRVQGETGVKLTTGLVNS